MLEAALLGLLPLLLIAGGFAILWYWAVSPPGVRTGNEITTRAARALGASLLIVGILSAVAVMSSGLAIVLWFATIVVIVASVTWYWQAERLSLLWLLTVAAERGIPLESAARAFAEERNDRVGRKALLLADYLEAGVPLALALQRSGNRLPPAAMLAADLGQESGTLGFALRHVAGTTDRNATVFRSAAEGIFYLAFLTLSIMLIASFHLLKIIPVYARMFLDFQLALPPTTQWLIDVARHAVSGWLLIVPLVGFWIAVVTVAILWYVGYPPQNFPLVRRLWWSADCALVMRWLALSVRQNRPIGPTIRQLALRHPHRVVRARLEQASRRIDRGGQWCDSLRQSQIFRRSECALFKAAERAGNLPWALEEMADSGQRRALYRLRAWTAVLFPLAVIVFAGPVLFLALAVLTPLFQLIEGLT